MPAFAGMTICLLLAALFVFVTAPAAAQTPASAQTELLPGYADHPLRGPAAAKGAVIYSHGLERSAEATPEMPYVLDPLRDSGWDVFRLQRRWAADTLPSSAGALYEVLRKLRGEGYDKVVLAGQSFGGWISLAVATGREPVHAVVALAPAAFGTPADSPIWTHNADGLYEMAEALNAARTVVFLFDGDDYDPGERGEKLREIFARRDVVGAVVDRPVGLAGHGVGLSRGFARRFGDCLRDFIETTSPSPRFVCGGEPPVAALNDFTLPPDARVRQTTTDTEPGLRAILGRWYGVYPNGREVLLIVTEVGRDRARAIYSFGPLSRHQENQSAYTPRRGEYSPASGTLAFTEPQASSKLEARLAPDGRLDFTWTHRQSGAQLKARLRKVE